MEVQSHGPGIPSGDWSGQHHFVHVVHLVVPVVIFFFVTARAEFEQELLLVHFFFFSVEQNKAFEVMVLLLIFKDSRVLFQSPAPSFLTNEIFRSASSEVSNCKLVSEPM